MKMEEVEAAQEHRATIQYYSDGTGWLPVGWHHATIAGVDSNKEQPRVWLRVGNSGGVTLEGRKDIRERLRVKETTHVDQ